MLLAYAYCFGPTAGAPEMCIIPSKPDQFSCIVRVHSLIPTKAAICRLSPTEGIRVLEDADPRTLIIEPINPAKLFLTPSQLDRPGLEIRQALIKFIDDTRIDISYKQSEKEPNWKEWRPNETLL